LGDELFARYTAEKSSEDGNFADVSADNKRDIYKEKYFNLI
jgi:hypothetical protein